MASVMIAYEELLNGELQTALREGSMHFEQKSAVHLTLRKIAARVESPCKGGGYANYVQLTLA